VRSLQVLQRSDLQLVIPALAVAEVTYIVGRRLGSQTEAAFLRSLEEFDVEAPSAGDWPCIADLVGDYAESHWAAQMLPSSRSPSVSAPTS
jgi:hypothetical protein